MARAVASMLYDLGAISQNKYVEVQRSDLVGGFKGSTSLKTKAVV